MKTSSHREEELSRVFRVFDLDGVGAVEVMDARPRKRLKSDEAAH